MRRTLLPEPLQDGIPVRLSHFRMILFLNACDENVTWSPSWLPRLWHRGKTLEAPHQKILIPSL